ncbi:Uncharacterised protein [Vibrio cholerae]|nr:Uncharacterised protein [Vibrio cholerae]CSI63288.1 Uncharacterised protein [Vibrio cholerae]
MRRSSPGGSWTRYNAASLAFSTKEAEAMLARIIHSSISLCASLRTTGSMLSILR